MNTLSNKKLSSETDNKVEPIINFIERDGILEMYLRGYFTSPRENSAELITLETLTSEYDSIEVTINSSGGDATLLTAILSILKKFKNVVTIAEGEISSAGSMLWATGDVRVIKDYTTVMMHRESYFKGYDKTENHLGEALHTSKLFEKLMSDVFKDVLTAEELEKAKTSEVFFTPEELIQRGVCISFDEYLEKKAIPFEESKLIHIGEQTFIQNEDGTLSIVDELSVIPTKFKTCEVRYKYLEFKDPEEE